MPRPWLFGVKKNDNDILKEPIPEAKASGIEVTRLHPSLVPLYEEHDARIEAGYNWTEWYELGRDHKAMEIAHYRLRKSVEGHQVAAHTKGKR